MNEELYLVERIVDPNPDVAVRYKISRYTDASLPSDVGNVLEFRSGKWYSDDPGFLSHQNEKASKRIRIAKEYKAQGYPACAAYWIEDGKVKHLILGAEK